MVTIEWSELQKEMQLSRYTDYISFVHQFIESSRAVEYAYKHDELTYSGLQLVDMYRANGNFSMSTYLKLYELISKPETKYTIKAQFTDWNAECELLKEYLKVYLGRP